MASCSTGTRLAPARSGTLPLSTTANSAAAGDLAVSRRLRARAILARANEAAGADPGGFLGRRLGQTELLTLDDIRSGLDAGDEETRRIVVGAGRFLGQAVAALIGALNIGQIVLIGAVAALGEPWLDAVRDEARRRSLGLLTDETRIDLGRTEHDVVLGASALLMTRELGLVPVR